MGRELLEGERVVLRRMHDQDAPAVLIWWQDMGFSRMLRRSMVYPTIEKDLREWLFTSSEDFYPFAIAERETNRIVGVIALKNVPWQARHASFFVGIGSEEDRGRGFASDAIRVMLRYAFMEMNLHRIGLEFSAYNEAARRTYEHLGFQHEGVLRQFIYRDGVYHDVYQMSMLRSEWEARKG